MKRLHVKPYEIFERMKYSSGEPNLDELLSGRMAANIIGTNANFICHAVRKGFLPGQINASGSEIKRSDLIDFNNKYIVASEMAKLLNCSRTSVARRTKSRGVRSVAEVFKVRLILRSESEASFKEELCGAPFRKRRPKTRLVKPLGP
jgi:hypothetical protein